MSLKVYPQRHSFLQKDVWKIRQIRCMPVAHFLLFYIVDEQKKQFLFYVSCIVNGILINKYKWNFVINTRIRKALQETYFTQPEVLDTYLPWNHDPRD